MSGPKDVFRRAEANRKQTFTPVLSPMPPVVPVPVPQPVPANQPTVPQVQDRIVVPQPIRQNSVYHQLMQKHDRMTTRHLKG